MTKRFTAALALLALCIVALAPAGASAQRARAPRKQQPAAHAHKEAGAYSCPMHPEVVSAKPGRCPKCGMNLTAAEKKGATPAKDAAPAPRAADGEAPQIPDVPVLDQTGRRLNFYTDLVKGKTVAVNFIFTTCTTVCPPLTATFRRVQQELGDRAGRDVQLISVSVDPTTDTPERLNSFAAKFHAGPGWTFVTGGKPEISALLKSLGAATADKNDHTPMILVGNEPAGHWTRTYGLAPASSLVKVINDAAAKPDAAASKPSGEVSLPMPKAGGESGSAQGASAKYFPNHVLITQDNKPVHFYDDMLKGKVVLINFVFTTCTGVCPPMTANLAKVQSYLGDRVGKDVHIISISVDPTVDTPEKLKKYADGFKARPGWYFLTGEKQNVDWVLYKLGGYVEDKMQHSGILIIGNEATGEWLKTPALRNPAQIAQAVVELLKKKEN
ncbi:MAG TPA: SCO family protein [Pyrinomonadaceae bacterium]|jgi:cytochrome oxidase Cu insertion factor (SCO1/SenC/PrrC family)|nr:SCO family protein [Pyrinomonadaceae bacterium]